MLRLLPRRMIQAIRFLLFVPQQTQQHGQINSKILSFRVLSVSPPRWRSLWTAVRAVRTARVPDARCILNHTRLSRKTSRRGRARMGRMESPVRRAAHRTSHRLTVHTSDKNANLENLRCFDCRARVSVPAGIPTIDQLITVASSVIPLPSHHCRPSTGSTSKGNAFELDGFHTSVLPSVVLRNEAAAEAWGLNTLKPLECCNGYVARRFQNSQRSKANLVAPQTMSMLTRKLQMRFGMLRLLLLLQLRRARNTRRRRTDAS
jgi:hypothetical protein